MKSKSTFFVLTIFLFLALTCLTCRGQRLEWKGTITEENGVIIVKNPKEPLHPDAEFKIVQDLKIGLQESQPEYMFSSISDLEVDAEGNIYAVEQKDQAIRVFDKNGAYRMTIGRPGQGPSEFDGPANIHVNQAGEVMVTNGEI